MYFFLKKCSVYNQQASYPISGSQFSVLHCLFHMAGWEMDVPGLSGCTANASRPYGNLASSANDELQIMLIQF